MNEITIFNDPELGKVRSILIDNDPWFVGKDVATVLEYTNIAKAIRDHVDPEDKGVNEMDTPGGKQKMTIINESGLYALIFGSKLEKAKKIKRWVTNEVLPALRRKGSYSLRRKGSYSLPTAPDAPRMTTTDDYIKAAQIVSTCRPSHLALTLDLLQNAGIRINSTEYAKIKAVSGADAQSAARIIELALQSGMTQEELARAAGVTRPIIYRIRRGNVKDRGAHTQEIAKAVMDRLPTLVDEILEDSARGPLFYA